MKHIFGSSARSAGFARERMKQLLMAERLDCSFQISALMKEDISHCLRKYILIEPDKIKIDISQDPPVLTISAPVQKKKDD